MEQVGEFLGSSQKQSSKSVVMGDIFFMFTRSLHYTQSHWMLLPINFLTVSFWLLWNDNWWTLSIDFVHVNDEQKLHWVIVQELNHNYTPFVSFLFEFSIFCSSTLLANKGSSRGSIPCRVGESGSKEQFSSRITLLRSSPWRSWWRFRMGLVVDRSRWASEPSASITLLKKMIGIQMTETKAIIQPTPIAQDGYLYSNVFLL